MAKVSVGSGFNVDNTEYQDSQAATAEIMAGRVTDLQDYDDYILNPVGELQLARPVEAPTTETAVEAPLYNEDTRSSNQEGDTFTQEGTPTAEGEAVLERQQEESERHVAMHSGADMTEDFDIGDIVGDENVSRYIDGYTNTLNLDDVGLSKKFSSRLEEYRVMNGKRQDNSVAEGEVDRSNYVDRDNTIKLSNPQLFAFLDATTTAGKDVDGNRDKRDLVLKPMFKIISLAIVESKLADMYNQESLMPEGITENFSKEEASEILGVSETELPSQEGESAIGKMIQEEWAKLIQRGEVGPDQQLDAHLNPDKKLSKEAQEMLGLWAKQQYAVAFPHMFKQHSTVNKAGNKRNDYLLTAEGHDMMEKKLYATVKKAPKVKPAQTTGNNANSVNVPFSTTTGTHFNDKKIGRKPELEGQKNLAAVPHMATLIRMKVGIVFSLLALGKSTGYTMVDNKVALNVDESNPHKLPLDILDLGQEAVDKINNADTVARLKAEAITYRLLDMSPRSPMYEILLKRREELLKFAEIASAVPVGKTLSWRERMYKQRATNQLAMVQDIASYHETAIRFPNYVQEATSRISYKPTVMNPQNHKFARQMYGSSTRYDVVPGSGSEYERSMLMTMGAHLFADGWATPDKVYRNMRDRINDSTHNDHPKVLAIATVGRKISNMLGQYEVETSIEALKAMETTPENVVKGTGAAFVTIPDMDMDEDVKSFINHALDHPNEFVMLVEEAVELGRYMDSLKGKTLFSSTMGTVEFDGIQNGLAGIGLDLGVKDMMYRVGVLSEDPDKVFADYEGVLGTLRDEFKYNMQDMLGTILNSVDFKSDFGDVDIETMSGFLEAATDNSSEFLKPPLMTFAYGQATSSMIGIPLSTINSSPVLKGLIESSPYETIEVARMLHVFITQGLTATLHPDVIAYSEAVKDMTMGAMMANEEIRYPRPTGSMTSLNSVAWKTHDERHKINQTLLDKDDNPVFRTELHPTSRQISGLAGENTSGSTVTTSALASVAMAKDGGTIISLVTGDRYKRLQKRTNQDVPYITSIYDAVKGDLGSTIPMIEILNEAWKDTIGNYDMLMEVHNGARDANKRGLDKMSKLAENNPNGLVLDKDQARYMVSYMQRVISDDTFETEQNPSTEFNKVFSAVRKNSSTRLKQIERDSKFSARELQKYQTWADSLTNHEVFMLYQVVLPRMEKKLAVFKGIAHKANNKKQALLKELEGLSLNQYAMDNLKYFNFHSPSVAPTGRKVIQK